MELNREERLGSAPNALVRAIVDVDEPGLPVAGKGVIIHRVAVILARDVAPSCQQVLHGLIHRAMAVGELERVISQGQAEYLMTETNAEQRKR